MYKPPTASSCLLSSERFVTLPPCPFSLTGVDLAFFMAMLFTPIAAASLLAVVGTQPTGVFAQDAEGWYKAHPGMSRIKDVNQDTHQIVDEFGRTRFFHGTNVVMKEPPWHRPLEWVPGVSSFGEQDVQNLHDLGLNIVRLGHSWAGAEPMRGEYNQTFLDIMKKQTKMAEDHGLYVLVDVHQDCLARQFCGNGVPDVSRRPDRWAQLILTWLPSGLPRKIGYRVARCIRFPSKRRRSRWMKTASLRHSRFAVRSTGL